jgi:hypothetical protein
MTTRRVPSTGLAPAQRPQADPLDPELLEILGPPPILKDENVDAYNALHDRFRSSVVPEEVMEEIWVRDVVDLTWEILRVRRLKAKFIDGRASKGIEHLLMDLVDDYQERKRLLRGSIDRKVSVTRRVDKLLAGAGHDRETVTAETLAVNLDEIERLDRMVMQAEARRNVVIREMDRHRDVVARLREVVADIEDAEFEEISAPDMAAAE